MRWRRCDPVQDVSALIVRGVDAASRLARALASRNDVLGALAVEHGERWAAVLSGADAMLPRITGALALYEASPGRWLPVGVELDVPRHARDPLWGALVERSGLRSGVIVVPRFVDDEETSAAVDLYPIGQSLPFRLSALADLA